jgi:hypothetical protein
VKIEVLGISTLLANFPSKHPNLAKGHAASCLQ